MKILNKIIQTLILIATIFGVGYFFQDDISMAWQNINKKINPCGQPISYSIGDFNEKFGLDQKEFLDSIKQAENIWEESINKELFQYEQDGELRINLIYDARQEATIKLEKLGIEIHNDQNTYESLKEKYDSFVKEYDALKFQLDKLINDYEIKKASYEAEIKRLNKRGGARPDEYTRLEQERNNLNNQVIAIKNTQTDFNNLVDKINAIVNVINRLIYELNLNVNNYNTIGGETAGEFQEGEYVSDTTGERINIYQFNNKEMLIRLLAHELGHALGLEHSDNPGAIMYRLNQEESREISNDDITSLKAVCGIK